MLLIVIYIKSYYKKKVRNLVWKYFFKCTTFVFCLGTKHLVFMDYLYQTFILSFFLHEFQLFIILTGKYFLFEIHKNSASHEIHVIFMWYSLHIISIWECHEKFMFYSHNCQMMSVTKYIIFVQMKTMWNSYESHVTIVYLCIIYHFNRLLVLQVLHQNSFRSCLHFVWRPIKIQ